MEKIEPLFTMEFYNFHINITSSIVIQWVIILLLGILSIILTRNLKYEPSKKQNVVEIFVETVNNLVKENMGEQYKGFVPFIGALMVFIAAINTTGLFGFEPPSSDFSVSLGMALVTFAVIQAYTIKKVGLVHYFIGYAKPLPILLPINIMERLMLPVSLSLRLFGNITAGAVILNLVYSALQSGGMLFQLGIPIPLHFYFDIFDGLIQMVIFAMLTMINIKIISEH